MESFNGFYLVEIPIPVPLKVVNCYLTKSPAGWHIIDTGFHTEEAKLAWKNAFRELRIAPKDIVEIVLTHFHPDHMGLAGWLQEYTKAPVKISADSEKMIQHLWIDKKELELFDGFAYKNGMSQTGRTKVAEYLLSFPKYVNPFPEFTIFEEGDVFQWAEDYTAIHTPGHADGHMVFYSSNNGVILAGDLLLPKITPNVGYFPGFHTNPLKAFLDSLQKIQAYQLHTVLSGHRQVYNNGNKRANEIIGHHEKRLSEILMFLKEPGTAQDVSEKLFAHLSRDADPLQLLFALQETLAHLIYLKENSLIRCETGNNGIVIYGLEQQSEEAKPLLQILNK